MLAMAILPSKFKNQSRMPGFVYEPSRRMCQVSFYHSLKLLLRTRSTISSSQVWERVVSRSRNAERHTQGLLRRW